MAACDVETGYGVVSVATKKDPQDKHAVRVMLQPLEELGCSSRVILQSDAEAGATELVRAVASSRPGKTITRQCPVASHGSNGTLERFIQSFKDSQQHCVPDSHSDRTAEHMVDTSRRMGGDTVPETC